MVLTVRGKEFKIDFVSNEIHELYGEIRRIAFETSARIKSEEVLKVNETDPVKAGDMIREFEILRMKNVSELIQLRYKAIKEIITSNGLDFDESWWKKKTTPEDLTDFLFDCVMKDISNDNQSKKK